MVNGVKHPIFSKRIRNRDTILLRRAVGEWHAGTPVVIDCNPYSISPEGFIRAGTLCKAHAPDGSSILVIESDLGEIRTPAVGKLQPGDTD